MVKLRTLILAAAAVTLASTAAAERGTDGELRMLYWQAPSILNPYLSGGTKDIHAASLILEPLARYDENGDMVPWLAAEIPTLDNGGVAQDLMSITWTLRDDVVWSDGTPFTAEDVAFTAAYCMDPDRRLQLGRRVPGGRRRRGGRRAHGADRLRRADAVPVRAVRGLDRSGPAEEAVRAVHRRQSAGVHGRELRPDRDGTLQSGRVPSQRCGPLRRQRALPQPRPAAFSSVLMKGGGDAVSAARAVLVTGEFDYGWNLQVEPEILADMEKSGKGEVVTAFGTLVERLVVNMTNPDSALGDARSTYQDGANPHPFLSDPMVVRALSMAIDREILVDAGYGPAGQVTCNVLSAPAVYASTANDWCLTPDIEGANRLLDEAGWVRGRRRRSRQGRGTAVGSLQTSTNSVRQGTQALIKQMWREIGVETELRNINASVFFGSDPASPDTYQKFYADIQMYTNNFDGTDPQAYMTGWVCDKIPWPANQWNGSNISRYCNPAYDALAAAFAETGGIEARAAIAKRMNDLLVEDGALVPLIHRGEIAARSLSLGGVRHSAWDATLWNINEWHRVE